jgi:diguanylate cyclase (GGDEF)-like protein
VVDEPAASSHGPDGDGRPADHLVDRVVDRFVDGLGWLERVDWSRRWTIVTAAFVTAVMIDAITGPEASVMLEYVISVALAAWLLRGWSVPAFTVAGGAASGIVRLLDPGPPVATWMVAVNTGLRAMTLAVVALIVAGLRRHVEHAERAVRIDVLTGCESRRAILDRLESEVRQAHRHGTPLCVLYLDLDAFKAVNDRYGHAAGDAVLRRFVDLVGMHVRERDVLGRVGGDEFLLICPATAGDEAYQLARRLRAVQGIPEVSIGVAELHARAPDVVATVAASELLARADAAMYATKPRRTA